MSFFGFDASLPKEKPGASKGIFEHNDPFKGIAQARKLQAFQANDEEEYGLSERFQTSANVLPDLILRTHTMASVISFKRLEMT